MNIFEALKHGNNKAYCRAVCLPDGVWAGKDLNNNRFYWYSYSKPEKKICSIGDVLDKELCRNDWVPYNLKEELFTLKVRGRCYNKPPFKIIIEEEHEAHE